MKRKEIYELKMTWKMMHQEQGQDEEEQSKGKDSFL